MELPYHFDDGQRAVVFHRHALPAPWINYLSNGTLHAFVSQAGGGFCWWRSPVIYRLTRYRHYNLPIDSPGFYVYIREPDGTTWSPSFRPCETPLDTWEARHQPGRTTFTARRGDIEASLALFVAPDHDAMVWDLRLKNHGLRAVALDVFGYVELSQLIWLKEVTFGYYNKWMVRVDHDADLDAVLYLNHLEDQPRMDRSPLVYFASTRLSASFSGNRDLFCGPYRDERRPVAVERGQCENSSLRGGEGCAALQVKAPLAAGGEERLAFFLGATPGVLKNLPGAIAAAHETLRQLRAPGAVQEQSDKVDAWWREHLDVMQCAIPDADAQRQINTWNPVQSVHTGRYSRSISSAATGLRGIGFRDTCQDMLAIAYRKPQWAKEMLLYQLALQFEDGHTANQSWPEENRPAEESPRSDNHLWLPLLVSAVVSETGDLGLLDAPVPFLAPDLVSKVGLATVWEHLMRVTAFTESHLGAHGLPLILLSDWNDHIGTFAREGRGETLMAAQQYVYALRLMLALAEACGDRASAEKLGGLLEKQCATIRAHGWDGQWWRRAYDDDGRPVGTSSDTYGRVWLNTQSWAVLGQVDGRDRLVRGMDAVRQWLDTDYGLRLLAPGFPTWPEVDRPAVKGLPPGCAENGGVFCHANTWAIIAEAMLGRAENAWKYYRQLIPHITLQTVGLERYQAEPYAYVSTVFGPENVRHGWANVAQVTGTAAWMDVAATQYLLGVRPEPAGLRIDPCIPADWRSFEVSRTFRGCRLRIEVDNRAGVEKGVAALVVDGRAVDASKAPVIPASWLAGQATAHVSVRMG